MKGSEWGEENKVGHRKEIGRGEEKNLGEKEMHACAHTGTYTYKKNFQSI